MDLVEQRFWSSVDKTDCCWNWMAGKTRTGYGQFKAGGLHGAHRYSYVLRHSHIPQGMQINHHCDNRACVNPDHLYAGTAKQNMQDMLRRGRDRVIGSRNGHASLNEEIIPFVRLWLSKGYKQREISQAFGIGRNTLYYIKSGRSWSHVMPAARKSGS